MEDEQMDKHEGQEGTVEEVDERIIRNVEQETKERYRTLNSGAPNGTRTPKLTNCKQYCHLCLLLKTLQKNKADDFRQTTVLTERTNA